MSRYRLHLDDDGVWCALVDGRVKKMFGDKTEAEKYLLSITPTFPNDVVHCRPELEDDLFYPNEFDGGAD